MSCIIINMVKSFMLLNYNALVLYWSIHLILILHYIAEINIEHFTPLHVSESFSYHASPDVLMLTICE